MLDVKSTLTIFHLTFMGGGKKCYYIQYFYNSAIQNSSKIRLHLFNHEYSNRNIPYINEDLFALLLCKRKYTYLLNV